MPIFIISIFVQYFINNSNKQKFKKTNFNDWKNFKDLPSIEKWCNIENQEFFQWKDYVLSFPKNNVMGNRRAPTRYTPPTPTYRTWPVIVFGDFSSIVCRSLNTLLLLPPTAPLPMSSFGVKMLALE